MNERLTYIFGHKNPDTDTICSAIVMAEMQKKMGVEAEAVRLGEINKETKYVLDYFNENRYDTAAKISKEAFKDRRDFSVCLFI